MPKIELAEAGKIAPSADAGVGGKRFKIRLIEADVWGSSGYYSHQVLEAAAKANIFRKGTKMYIDHPSATEQQDRPERSILDLAGTLDTDATIEVDGLWGEAVVYDHYAPVIEAIKDDIGVSIRAWANMEHGEAKGRKGPIITEFTEAASVDYVTTPGAGGRVAALLESARGQVHTLIDETTMGDRREQIERALPERSYLRDYDPDKLEAYFTTYDRATDKAITYAQTYEVGENDQSVALTGDPHEVRVVTTYVPVASAGQATTESTSQGVDHMPEIPADRLADLEAKERALEEAKTKLAEAEAKATTEAEKRTIAERKIAESDLQTAAREHLATKVTDLHPNMRARISTALTAEAGLIPVKDGVIDIPGLDAKIAEAITAEQEYLKPFAPKGVTGFGASAASEAGAVAESEVPGENAWGRSRKSGKIEKGA